jgi:arylsulfatase A-like enzyme
MALQAIEILREIKKEGKEPFFLATGFHKPHLPFVAPKKYWDLYAEADIQLADNPYLPQDAPFWAVDNAGELRVYGGVPKKGDIPEDLARKMIHGYYACISYVDAQIGLLLDEIERLGMNDNTIVVLWGDHGWKLGEHGDWGKHTNFELDTNAPLMIHVPGQPNAGARTSALVEFVDVYPTLAELCGLTPPTDLEGLSFVPVIQDPARAWKKAAFSQWPARKAPAGPGMGYSMRTDRYRFVEWQFQDEKDNVCELYDHSTDPNENVSLALQPEYKQLVEELRQQLRAGWKAALPQA